MKSIFITGAASGIGRAAARRFAQQGWRVGVADRAFAAAQAVAAELGAPAEAFELEVVDPGSVERALASFCRGDRPALDVLFNSAGVLEMQLFERTPLARLHQVIDVNVKGVVNCLHAAIPYLAAAPGAHAITMGSASAVYGIPEEAVYSASKFAVRGLTEALNLELAARDIWVSDVMVGYVRTPMVESAPRQAKSVELLGYSAGPEDVAEVVWQAAHGREVHWFVAGADHTMRRFDAASAAERRAMVASITGF